MSETIGLQLRQAREARKLSPEQVATALRIRLRYVEAMETGDFRVFPSLVQARGFLRSYARYLNLEFEPLLADLDGENPSSMASAPPVPDDLAPDVTAPVDQVDKIFAEIGQKLRTQRELLGLSVDDVEQHTHLRRYYLLALESGNLDELPSPVQGRGMLKNYAGFLGLDPDVLLLRFAEGLQARLAARRSRMVKKGRLEQSAPVRSGRRTFVADLLIAGFLIALLIGFIGWGVVRISAMRAGQTPTGTAPSIADVLVQKDTPTPINITTPTAPSVPMSPVVDETTPTEQATSVAIPPEFGNAPVQVFVVVRQRAWMRVTVDGKVEFEGRVLPGSAFPFAGDKRVELVTGNGAALEVSYNQTDLGTLGSFGEVVQRIFTVQGVQTPTPTITPTPGPATAVPTPTATEKP